MQMPLVIISIGNTIIQKQLDSWKWDHLCQWHFQGLILRSLKTRRLEGLFSAREKKNWKLKHLSEGLNLRTPLAFILKVPHGADQRCENLSILGSSIIQFRDLMSSFWQQCVSQLLQAGTQRDGETICHGITGPPVGILLPLIWRFSRWINKRTLLLVQIVQLEDNGKWQTALQMVGISGTGVFDNQGHRLISSAMRFVFYCIRAQQRM